MHVHRQPSKTYKMEEPPALEEVQPYKAMRQTSSKWTLTHTLTWTLTIQHTEIKMQGKKPTFFQDHQNSDHLKMQGKKPTFFQDHQNSEHLKMQRKKPTFFQDHLNSDHSKQWHTDIQRKKPTFFQDHLNSNRLSIQKLRS